MLIKFNNRQTPVKNIYGIALATTRANRLFVILPIKKPKFLERTSTTATDEIKIAVLINL